jgi:hypothetical protein
MQLATSKNYFRKKSEKQYIRSMISTVILIIFFRVYLNIFETSFPIVYLNKYNDNAWIIKGIRISCKKKRSLYLLSRNCNTPEVKLYYKH